MILITGLIVLIGSAIPSALAITGGRTAFRTELPHMARIGYKLTSRKSLECGGTIISKFFVLSAAHCASYFIPFKQEANYVVLGSWHHNPEVDTHSEEFGISEIHVHPKYNDDTLENDIALFKLNREVHFNSYIRPIHLYEGEHLISKEITIAGWGDESNAGKESRLLKIAHLSLQPIEKCSKLHPDIFVKFNATTMLCAGYLPGGKDACQGDSGGPLQVPYIKSPSIVSYSQIGIVSYGRECGLPNTPAVYTKIWYYIPWIRGILSKTVI